MTRANLAQPKQVQPLLFSGLTWREFKAIQQLLEQPGYRLRSQFSSSLRTIGGNL